MKTKKKIIVGHQLWIKHKQDWGQGFIHLLPRAAALPESDAGEMVLSRNWVSSSKPSDHVLHTQYHMPAVRHAVKTWSAVCSAAPGSQSCEGVRPHCAWTNGITLTPVCRRLSLTQAVRRKPNPSYWSRIGCGYEITKPECILTVLRVLSMIRPLGNTRLASSIQLSSRPEIVGVKRLFRSISIIILIM